MVKRIILALCVFAATSIAHGKERCTEGSEFEPPLCPVALPRIQHVSIIENGATSPAEPESTATCSRFRLTESQVRRYFAKARSANPSDVHYTLDWSPCSASGTLVFQNGKAARWSITQSRAGSLTMDNGEEITLYCPTCKFKPFR